MSRRGVALTHVPTQSWLDNLGAFRVSPPALDHFPIGVWSKLVARHSRKLPRGIMAYGDAMGYLPFREAIAEYLGAARGVRCEASQILVTTGSQQALQISAQVLLDPKDRVWMEEPGYPGARPAFMTVGAVLTDFIRQGHFARHIRRMRMLYMERRRALVNAIQMQMGEITEVIGTEAGMHLVALLPSGIDDVAVCMKAAQKAVSAIPLSTCYLKPPTRGGLILGYGGANAHQIHDGIRKLRMSVSSRIA